MCQRRVRDQHCNRVFVAVKTTGNSRHREVVRQSLRQRISGSAVIIVERMPHQLPRPPSPDGRYRRRFYWSLYHRYIAVTSLLFIRSIIPLWSHTTIIVHRIYVFRRHVHPRDFVLLRPTVGVHLKYSSRLSFRTASQTGRRVDWANGHLQREFPANNSTPIFMAKHISLAVYVLKVCNSHIIVKFCLTLSGRLPLNLINNYNTCIYIIEKKVIRTLNIIFCIKLYTYYKLQYFLLLDDSVAKYFRYDATIGSLSTQYVII